MLWASDYSTRFVEDCQRKHTAFLRPPSVPSEVQILHDQTLQTGTEACQLQLSASQLDLPT